jgi:endonuclease/exonuclease/phosphatase family metal-dependent hydrolase
MLMAIAALSPVIHPKITVIPAILAGSFPVLILITLLLAAILFFIDLKYIILPLLTLIVFWNPLQKHWSLGLHSPEIKREYLGIATFNLFGLKHIKKAEDEKLMNELEAVLSNPDLDVLCLQESNGYSNQVIDKVLDFDYKYQYLNSGVKLVSKYPILDKGTFDFNSTINSCLWANLQLEDRKVRVYCTHLQSNRVGDRTSEIMEKGDLTEKTTWLGIRSVMSRYRKATLIREEQSNRIKTHAQHSEYPVIFCGDLNDHPLSYPVTKLSEGWKDTFREKGSGWGTTYGGKLPLLRIDYIMVDSSFEVVHQEVTHTDLSDHYFVEAIVQLKD